ncbi:MAG: DHH family phosphoesterase [Actinomycetota bacterium]
MRYDIADWDETLRILRDADEVVCATHINPDGDAIGTVLAASLGLQQLGKKTYPTWGESPLVIPFNYSLLPAADTFVEPADVPETPVFLALDCGAADRLGGLETRATAADCLINVDHHAGNDGFGKLNIVVTSASSTAELMTRLLQDLDVDIDSEIATCLYAGIVTDTGRFQYANSSPDVLRLAADLIERGVDWVEVAHQVFESAPFGYLKLLGRVLERAVLHEEEGFVYSWLTRRDLVETAVAMDETDKLIDAVRTTRSAEIAAMFKEQRDGSYRASLRSKGPRSVGAIARAQGGGGHELAAGFTAPSVDEAVEIVLSALRSGH